MVINPAGTLPWDFIKEPEKTIKCKECNTLYKGKDVECTWETDKRFNGLCRICFMKKLNNNLTKKDIEYYANWAVDNADCGMFGHHPDITYENHKKYIEPEAEKIVKQRNRKAKEAHEHKIYMEAKELVAGDMDPGDIGQHKITSGELIDIVADLLERIHALENKTPLSEVKFS